MLSGIDVDAKMNALKQVVKTMGTVHWPHVDEVSVKETVARLFDRFCDDQSVMKDERMLTERATEQYENEQKRTYA